MMILCSIGRSDPKNGSVLSLADQRQNAACTEVNSWTFYSRNACDSALPGDAARRRASALGEVTLQKPLRGVCCIKWESSAHRPGGNRQRALPARRGLRAFYPSVSYADTSPFRGGYWRASALGEVTLQKPLRGVCCIKWESSAHRPRRESAAGTARPEGIGSGLCPPGGNRPRGLPRLIQTSGWRGNARRYPGAAQQWSCPCSPDALQAGSLPRQPRRRKYRPERPRCVQQPCRSHKHPRS